MSIFADSFQPLQQGLPGLAPSVGRDSPAGRRSRDIYMPSAASEINRLTEEYEREASQIAEQLDICGIRRESLSSKARLNLQLIASVASALHLSKSGPHLVLAAWSALVLEHSRATAFKFKLQQGVDEFVRMRKAAQAKLKLLQQLLHEVQSKQRSQATAVQKLAKDAANMQEKIIEYHRLTIKHQQQLDDRGFTPQVTHTALVTKHQQVLELQQRLTQLQADLSQYHHLPASQLGAEMMLKQAQTRLKEKQEKLQSHLADM